jgi:hypothetical protein|tara:strand:+ start:2261 stop:2713 length:453 start_codon:yes stop_codon:yes gene_type:complete
MERKSNPISLENIQEMWTKDAIINPDELDTESLKVPQLHAKYYGLYNTILLMRKQNEQIYSSLLLDRRKFYTGKATAAVYEAEPFPYKIRDKDDLKLYLESDEKLSKVRLKIEYFDSMLKYLEEILRQVTNRSYQIKNAIEWRRFTSGYG